ncbi:MAG: RnfH family protein [Betaproteobacteria bacterium]
MRITVAHCLAPRQVQEYQLDLPEGANAQQALQACGIWGEPLEQDTSGWQIGIWGRRCSASSDLHEGDRLELYRPLRVDPKVARRERFKGQGARSAGLFARRRPGAKSGY